jgi:hypothetical protein
MAAVAPVGTHAQGPVAVLDVGAGQVGVGGEHSILRCRSALASAPRGRAAEQTGQARKGCRVGPLPEAADGGEGHEAIRRDCGVRHRVLLSSLVIGAAGLPEPA